MSTTAEFSLLEAFKQIPDPRKRRGIRHPFHALMTLAATVMLVISFILLLVINALQAWTSRRTGRGR